ncbi:MAG: Z1 domain-containing protein [Selenomonas sp.]|nr:Z1 domain-containing protein [Selenomonas sp.]
MKKQYEDERIQGWIQYLNKKIKKRGWNRKKARMLGTSSDEELLEKLEDADEDLYYPFTSLEDWDDFIDYYYEQEEMTATARIIRNVERGSGDRIPTGRASGAWQVFRQSLLDKKEIPLSSVLQMEHSAREVLNLLEDGATGNHGPVHGLVMGNVQSGKTANMEALMSMTAEFGWNVYIVLTGTIENLRVQTEERMSGDLPSKGLGWKFLHDLSFTGADAPSKLNLREGDSDRYVITCLKNSSRLKTLLRWLNYDKSRKAQMRVLVIDDESDQAGLNTKKMDMQDGMTEAEAEEAAIERTRINEEIMAIVNGNTRVGSDDVVPYLAMNYVCYTATPYGNFLNESRKGSLYPRDFIKVLPLADTYFGPQQIFGDPVNGTSDGLRIINEIPDAESGADEVHDDVHQLEAIYDAWMDRAPTMPDLPQSLKEAIVWFCICVAIRRLWAEQDKETRIRPLSMMIHHSMKTNYHISIAKAVRQWYERIADDELIALCQTVYDEQTQRFSRDTFCQSWPDYGRDCGFDLREQPEDIRDYPPFADLREQLLALHAVSMTHITIGDRLRFSRGLILCVDNSRNVPVIEPETSDQQKVRLLYPREGDVCPTKVPAFLVVGGNTLARGLTLKGLVSTYFSRHVTQADTLMQMGRWFGYRRGYELLPRIWMTQNVATSFEAMTEIDIRLRSDIQSRYLSVTPSEYGPVIRTMPGISLTSRNKMQGSEPAEMSFAGAHLQTVEFEDIPARLANNIEVAEQFLAGLGEPVAELTTSHSRVWTGVPFSRIRSNLFEPSYYKLTRQASTEVFCDWFTQVAGQFDDWEVILYGRDTTKMPPEKIWHGVGKINRSRRLSGVREPDSQNLSIGALTDPNVWTADLSSEFMEKVSDEDRAVLEAGRKAKQNSDAAQKMREAQQRIREKAGKKNTPRLVLYCIDKDSQYNGKTDPDKKPSRCRLAVSEDLIGLELLVPGQTGNQRYVASVSVKMQD